MRTTLNTAFRRIRKAFRHALPWALIGYLVLAGGIGVAIIRLDATDAKLQETQAIIIRVQDTIIFEAELRAWQLCGASNEQFGAIRGSLADFKEALISASQRSDEPRTPEQLARQAKAIAAFEDDLNSRLEKLSPRDCGPKPTPPPE